MKKMLSTCTALCMLLLSACGTPGVEPPEATAPPTEVPAAPTHSNVAYVDDENPNHKLDIYVPVGITGPFPTIMFLHGAPGAKEDFIDIGDYFADQGYAVVIPEYEYGNEMPYTFQDVFCSLAWVHANPDQYDFDPQRIYLFGFSFGAYLSASLGSFKDPGQYLEDCPYSIPETDRVKGVVTYAGMFVTQEICMAPEGGWCMSQAASNNKILLMEMAGIFESLREVPSSDWKDSSELSEAARAFAKMLPLYWLDGSEPPFIIMHGDADDMVPIGDSEAFASAVQDAGGEAEFISIPGAGHSSLSLASPSFAKIAEEIEAFVSGQ